MKKISYFDFNRKHFIKILRKRIESSLLFCKLHKTNNLKLAQLNYKRILNIINETLQNKIIFDINNIFLIIQKLEEHQKFLDEYVESIKNTEDIESLKDRNISFFQHQSELESFFRLNYENPQPISLPE